jgi:hypothetical protein
MKFKVGDKVESVIGPHLRGTVIPHFAWWESTDHAPKAPNNDDVPVLWNNGTKAYENPAMIKRYIFRRDIRR